MNFSSLTGLDISVLVALAVSVVIAVITIVLLLMFVSKKLYTNADVTVRFQANHSNKVINVIPCRHKTQFGTISFVNRLTDDNMKNIKADIVVNGTGAAVSFTGLTNAANGTLKILNNTDADLTIDKLIFFPGNNIDEATFTVNALMNTMFRRDLLVKGKITVCNFIVKMSDPLTEPNMTGRMNVDLTLTRNKSTALESA